MKNKESKCDLVLRAVDNGYLLKKKGIRTLVSASILRVGCQVTDTYFKKGIRTTDTYEK